MSRIVGSHAKDAPLANAAVRTLLPLVTEPGLTRSMLEVGRCALGWSGHGAADTGQLGPVIVVLDGLFYNRKELDECAGLNGSVATDAMRLAMLYRLRGIEFALNSINGDFAAALYDRDIDTLWLARDRFGVRPLYYTESERQVAFASRPVPLLHLQAGIGGVNPRFAATFAGGHYRHFDNEPGESSFMSVRQLPAASLLRSRNGSITVRRYWDLTEQPDYAASESELAAQYRELLLDAVERRLAVAASPAFSLSGGMDSSSVLSCAVERSDRKQHAFSSVYADATYDETAEIRPMLERKVAKWHAVRIDTPDVLGTVRKMVVAHDEPVATATWLSHFLLCEEAARDGFKTLFGGLGGDELNAGEYEYFYFLFADLRQSWKRKRIGPRNIRMGPPPRPSGLPKSQLVVDENLARIVDFDHPGVCRPDVARMTKYYSAVDPQYIRFRARPSRHGPAV